jgi:hypothetical protein
VTRASFFFFFLFFFLEKRVCECARDRVPQKELRDEEEEVGF